VPERVTVTGAMVDSREFMDAMDVLVVPSLWEEPFGLVAVEGMARSLPVVVTRSGGLQEIVEHGVTGFIVEKDARTLREAVEALVSDRILRASMGDAGRERVQRMFHPEKQMGRIVDVVMKDEG
jgi:glycosyltransferase involved in cell wall biosynthesis